MYDIGEVAILQYVQQHEKLRDNPKKLLEAVKLMDPLITCMMLDQWNFGPELVNIGEGCKEKFRNTSDRPNLCDVVLIAQSHVMIGTPQQKRLLSTILA